MFERSKRWLKIKCGEARDILLALCFLALVCMIAFGPLVFVLLILACFAGLGVFVAHFTGSWLAGCAVFATLTAIAIFLSYDPGCECRRR